MLNSDRHAFDSGRRQLNAAVVIDQLGRTSRPQPADAALIAVTRHDLFWSARPEWQWTFGVIGTHNAVLSTARMDPRAFGLPRDDRLLERRLLKMITRYVGEMHFGLQRRSTAAGALRASVNGVDDLDAIGEHFCPAEPRAIKVC